MCGEVEGVQVMGQEGMIDEFGGFIQHRGDVAQMLLGAAFPEEFEFADDEVFGRSEGDRQSFDVDDSHVFHGPAVERVAGDDVNVCFEEAMLTDDIEVTAVAADDFRGDDFGWWKIEIIFGKCLDETGHVGDLDFEN